MEGTAFGASSELAVEGPGEVLNDPVRGELSKGARPDDAPAN